ncbi:MAG: N-acetylglucosamine-6-phosphate deacetylase [Spirulinaceae cyanobacterium RM2_2_10]|nr:N-acetylglucosamine-6-phosphate deacetylase [Spirulinaceae cyanobacterium SM2_1_0]NJO19310.1 N-acetylglucosamine-6-phosphate deacetylase [Spirulinaceae cyanobacterium RM2_2_10]
MPTSCTINNARLSDRDGLVQVEVVDGQIAAIAPMSTAKPAADALDLAGDWLSLGGLDLQINGGLGLAFPDLRSEHQPVLTKIGRYLWEQGVDGFYPTLVTTAIANIHRALAVIAASPLYREPPPQTARILGVHLEGPCLNPAKRGAHPPEHLQPLSVETLQQVLGDFAAVVKIMTLAPELETGGEAIATLRSQGITVSLGHSLATAAQAEQAFQQGATMVTHAFNAMPPLHHREPGLLGAALVHPNTWAGVIADGQHVCPTMLQLLWRAAGDRGLFLVSDALAPLGLPDGTYPWDSRQIEVSQGTARLPDGTLAGTTWPLLAGVQNLVNWDVCSPAAAIAAATTAPRQALGLPDLQPGQPASLLRWSSGATAQLGSWQRLTV